MSSSATAVKNSSSSALNTERSENGGSQKTSSYPTTPTKESERKWLLGQMAAAFRILLSLDLLMGVVAILASDVYQRSHLLSSHVGS